MREGALLSAAMEVVDAVERSGRPADAVLRQWGRDNRYAGSGDRARLGAIVYGVFRRRTECAWVMGAEDPRALVLARTVLDGAASPDALAALCDGTGHNPAPLRSGERVALARAAGPIPSGAQRNLPDWLSGELDGRVDADALGAALRTRAPLDLRVNTLAWDRGQAQTAVAAWLADQGRPEQPVATPYSPVGLRVTAPADEPAARGAPRLSQASFHQSGAIEVQDEGSQLTALLSAAAPGAQVVELGAGGGGKTLALASLMAGQGRIVAADTAARRLEDARRRAGRSGLPADLIDWAHLGDGGFAGAEARTDPDLGAEAGRADLVFIDAPCSGSGTWRRAPEARWQLHRGELDRFAATQTAMLKRGAGLVRPGGRLIYVTCSLLTRENGTVAGAFTAEHGEFEALPVRPLWHAAGMSTPAPPPETVAACGNDLLLGPTTSGTDGFFLAAWRRRAA